MPNGLALSEFKGYDTWQTIAPSQTDEGLKAILGNSVMINAYKAGIPDKGGTVPDGAMIAKLEWSKKSDDASPYAVSVPDKLKTASFMIKDAKNLPTRADGDTRSLRTTAHRTRSSRPAPARDAVTRATRV